MYDKIHAYRVEHKKSQSSRKKVVISLTKLIEIIIMGE